MAVKRERLPRGVRTWGHLAVAALLLNALPFSLFAYAELTIPSTLAGICNATSPLWGMALSLVALSEDRPTRRRVAGLGIGFLGVLTVLGVWQGFSGLDATGHGDGVAGVAQLPGRLDIRPPHPGRLRTHSHLSLTGAQLLLATVQLAVVTPAVHLGAEPLPRRPAARGRRAGGARHGPLAKGNHYDFLLLSLPDNDNYSHRNGPKASVESIARADDCFGILLEAAGGIDPSSTSTR